MYKDFFGKSLPNCEDYREQWKGTNESETKREQVRENKKGTELEQANRLKQEREREQERKSSNDEINPTYV